MIKAHLDYDNSNKKGFWMRLFMNMYWTDLGGLGRGGIRRYRN